MEQQPSQPLRIPADPEIFKVLRLNQPLVIKITERGDKTFLAKADGYDRSATGLSAAEAAGNFLFIIEEEHAK